MAQREEQVKYCFIPDDTKLDNSPYCRECLELFNQEQRKMDEFLARSKRLEKTKMNRMFVFGIFRPMVYMLFVTSNLFLFYIGCKGTLAADIEEEQVGCDEQHVYHGPEDAEDEHPVHLGLLKALAASQKFVHFPLLLVE